MEGKDITFLTLHYYKFFDSFHPKFMESFLIEAGVDSKFAKLFRTLNENMVRRIKIGQTIGGGESYSNGFGQGDPMSVLAAIIFIAVQFWL